MNKQSTLRAKKIIRKVMLDYVGCQPDLKTAQLILNELELAGFIMEDCSKEINMVKEYFLKATQGKSRGNKKR